MEKYRLIKGEVEDVEFELNQLNKECSELSIEGFVSNGHGIVTAIVKFF